MKESDCKVTDCGSHVQRIVTLDEDKGEITFVEGERVAASRDSQELIPLRRLPETFVTCAGGVWRAVRLQGHDVGSGKAQG